jgi:hypothetical protein
MIAFPRRGRAPLPVATGTLVVQTDGSVRVAGRLSDGSSFSCASNLTTGASFPLYAATRLAQDDGYLLGDIALKAEEIGSLAAGSPVTWQPANSSPFGRFGFHFSRFTAPAAGTPALNVDAVPHNLDVLATNHIGGMLAGYALHLAPNNVGSDFGTNVEPIALRIDARTGVVSGTLGRGRTHRDFTGVVWQDANSGFAILPGGGDAVTLTLVPIFTGQ